MTRVLGPYLRRRVSGQILGLLLALTGLIQILALLEVTAEVLDRKLGVPGLLRYAVLSIPGHIVFALPIAGLLGSMTALYAMARSREITALRTAGVGLTRVLLHLLPVPFLFALLQIGLSQLLVPVADASLNTWWESTIELESKPANPQWVRTSNGILLFERNSGDGQRLLDVRIYSRDPQGLLTLRTRARSADWGGSEWILNDARDTNLAPGIAPQSAAQRIWQSNLRPSEVMKLGSDDAHFTSMELADVIRGDRVGTQPLSVYQTVLMQSFAAPFTVLIMMLLAMPAAIVSERGGGGGRVLLALALGLGFLLANGIFSAFGTSGRIPPVYAAVTAPLLFAAFGFWQLRSCERS
jgi:lipopolysaccharide export system permease protein